MAKNSFYASYKGAFDLAGACLPTLHKLSPCQTFPLYDIPYHNVLWEYITIINIATASIVTVLKALILWNIGFTDVGKFESTFLWHWCWVIQ